MLQKKHGPKKHGLLALMKKKKETEDIKFIDTQEQDNSSTHVIKSEQIPVSPTLNIVHFAEQEDDTDLTLSGESSNPAYVVRKHLNAKIVTAAVHPVNIKRNYTRGRRERDSAVRNSSYSFLLHFHTLQILIGVTQYSVVTNAFKST